MRIKDALSSMRRKKTDAPPKPLATLYTPWGEEIKNADSPAVWPEYPRPQLERDNYRILNGTWGCRFTSLSDDENAGERQDILVPFSPEAPLSGVGRQLQPDEYLWYEKEIEFSDQDLERRRKGLRCILHFQAVDQEAVVFCNGEEAASHSGGYLPFHVEISRWVSDSPLLLKVRVRDVSDTSWQSRGKQALNRGGMFYTAQSGIWQSVWYEWVPKNYIERLEITPDIENGAVSIKFLSEAEFYSVSCTIYRASTSFASTNDTAGKPRPGQRTMALIGVSIQRESSTPNLIRLTLPKEDIRLWTPDEPYLYSFTIIADNDIIHSYFALRSFSVEPDEKGVPRFCLNHRPLFLQGLLDQGYWPDGLMSAPCDEAFLYDIRLAKNAGFNMLRKHLKIEAPRWYYHCDRLGMIVWQDMVCGGSEYNMSYVCYLPTAFPALFCRAKDSHYKLLARREEEGRLAWEQECMETIEHLGSAPSIAVWVPFNEGWGQFDAARITKLIKEKDPSRPVDHASGWFDQNAGDFKSVHNYFRKLKVTPDQRRAFVISEYGGYACHVRGHSCVDEVYGYRRYGTPEELSTACRHLLERQLKPLLEKGLSGAVYTQLSDIEEEVNGLVTYDRKVVKISRGFELNPPPEDPAGQ